MSLATRAWPLARSAVLAVRQTRCELAASHHMLDSASPLPTVTVRDTECYPAISPSIAPAKASRALRITAALVVM